jgi:hypothetical protein
LLGCLLVCRDASIDVLLQLFEVGKRGAVKRLALVDGIRVKWKWTLGYFFSQRSLFLCVLRFVEDDVQLAIWEFGNDAVYRPRNSTRRRRLECAAMIFPVATSSAAKRVVVPCRV